VSVRPSVGPSVRPSVRNLFFWLAETKTANDLFRVYELVFWQKLILEPNLGKLLIKDNMNFLTYDDRSDIKVMMSTPDCPPI